MLQRAQADKTPDLIQAVYGRQRYYPATFAEIFERLTTEEIY